MASAIDTTKETVTILAKHRDEQGQTKHEKVHVSSRKTDTLKHVEKKLVDTGVHRLERHSTDPRASVKKPAPKKGHGGKFTWEGPDFEADNELNALVALDEGDPNYLDYEVAKEGGEGVVVGEVEVGKLVEGREGVARVEVDPRLNV